MVSVSSSSAGRSPPSSVVPITSALLDASITERLPRYAWRGFLHALAVDRGASHYQDPITNDLVATVTHLAGLPNGQCRHLRERHCPHGTVPTTCAAVRANSATASCAEHEPLPVAAPDEAAFHLPLNDCGVGSDDERTTTTLCTNSTDVSHDSDDDSESSLSSGGFETAVLHPTMRRRGAGRGSSSPSGRRRVIDGTAVQHHSARAAVLPPYLRRHGPVMQASDMEDVDQLLLMPRYSQHAKLHQRATELGLDCYRDLNTGCVTFTRRFLLQGPCCGEDCRHCPYGRHRGRSFVPVPSLVGGRIAPGGPHQRGAWTAVPQPHTDQGYSSASTQSTSEDNDDDDDGTATSTDSVTSGA